MLQISIDVIKLWAIVIIGITIFWWYSSNGLIRTLSLETFEQIFLKL